MSVASGVTGASGRAASGVFPSVRDDIDREICESVLIALRFVDELSTTIADGPSDGKTHVRRMRVRLPLPACAATIQVLAVLLKQAREARDAHAAGESAARNTPTPVTDVDFTVVQIAARIERRIQARLREDNTRLELRNQRAAECWGVVVRNLAATIERAQAALFGIGINNA